MKQFNELLRYVRNNGHLRADRTGVGTIGVFGTQVRYNLAKGFPLVTTKKVHLKSIIHELLWFLSGDTNNNSLLANGVSIWNEWAIENGDLGPIYGKMWTQWPVYEKPSDEDLLCACTDLVREGATNQLDEYSYTIDQVQMLIDGIKNKPFSRRHILSGWNPQFLPDETISPQDNVRQGKQALPPCHVLAQFYVEDNRLSCQLYQRSCDLFLGGPFNVASYALLTMIIAKICGLEYGEFIHTLGDAHIYTNHLEQVDLQLSREPYPLPTLTIDYRGQKYNEFKYEDFQLHNYQSHPAIKATIAV